MSEPNQTQTTRPDDSHLSACPFCGGWATYVSYYKRPAETEPPWVINCVDCGASMGLAMEDLSKDMVDENWNRRTKPKCEASKP